LAHHKPIDGFLILKAALTNFQKKHSSHAITTDVDIVETAKAAKFFLSDGVILTGTATGSPASKSELQQVVESVGDSDQDRSADDDRIPVLIGSGIDPDNVSDFKLANGFIVGSYFKEGGKWQNRIDERRIEKLVRSVERIRT